MPEELDAAQTVEAYRRAVLEDNDARAQELCRLWARHNGCDIGELHEMAFGCLED